MPGPRLDSGRRDRKVTIQKLTESIGDSREPEESWTTETPFTLFASREDMVLSESSRERFVAGQISGRGETRWGCPYHPEIDPERVDVVKQRRVVHEGRVYDITAAIMVGRRQGIQLVTLAKVG